MNKPTQERLKELLYYSIVSGKFYWKKRRGGTASKGSEAGTKDRYGYIRIKIDRVRYSSHRLVFLYLTGERPESTDHINHIRDCNAWINLRAANYKINSKNTSRYKNNTSGICGVSFHKRFNKWTAHIRNGNIRIHLGYFSNIEDAIKSREEANINYGFHPNHGKPSAELLALPCLESN